MIHKFCGSEKRTEVCNGGKSLFSLGQPIPRPGWHLTKGAPKIGVRSTSAAQFLGEVTGAPICGGGGAVARSIYLLISGGRYFNAKRDPSSIHRDFLEKFDEPRAAEPPTVASNEAAGAVSPGISF